MLNEKNGFKRIKLCMVALFIGLGSSVSVMAQENIKLSDTQVQNIVERSYQYVAMYNVIQKFALSPASGELFTDGFNTPAAAINLVDHNVKTIARPNNDTLYQATILDIRHEAIIIKYPAIDSKYVVLETSGYSHYAGVPLASSKGDFAKETSILFYTDRTANYQGQAIEGVDHIVKSDSDIMVAFLRAMPHQIDQTRMKKIIQSLQNVKILTLSEFQGKSKQVFSDAKFPAYAATDGDIFENNLLEVMQFIFNHITFDSTDAMDKAVLAAYKPLGVEPGKIFNSTKVAQIDGAQFRKIAQKVAQKGLSDMSNPAVLNKVTPKMFMPKGIIDLETQVIQSVVGPIGLPAYQARYIPIETKDGKVMNAKHDYVIRMSKDEIPPAEAFWSLTLYDLQDGFFIPNDSKKYSVGENAGFKLNKDGGIDIYVTAVKPDHVPSENWLPINRGDIGINGMFRVYVPNTEKMKTWETPKFELL